MHENSCGRHNKIIRIEKDKNAKAKRTHRRLLFLLRMRPPCGVQLDRLHCLRSAGCLQKSAASKQRHSWSNFAEPKEMGWKIERKYTKRLKRSWKWMNSKEGRTPRDSFETAARSARFLFTLLTTLLESCFIVSYDWLDFSLITSNLTEFGRAKSASLAPARQQERKTSQEMIL